MRSSSGNPSPVGASKQDGTLIGPATDGEQGGDLPASKQDGSLIRPATDGAQGGFLAAFFTEEAMLRLEQGLRDQRQQQEGRHFSEHAHGVQIVDAPSFDLSGWQDSRPNIENPHRVGPGLQLPDEIARRRSPFWRWLKVDLRLCALLLVVGAAALGFLLKARTGGSTDAVPVNIKAHGRTTSVSPDNDQPRQPITNEVKPPAATPLVPTPSPAPPNKQPVEAQGPATPLVPMPSPAPPNKQPVEAQGFATPSVSETPAASPHSTLSHEPRLGKTRTRHHRNRRR